LRDEPSEIEVAYISGLLEGEGTFLRKGFCPIIQIGMTDLDVIEEAAKIINIGHRKIFIEDDKRPNHKLKYAFCLAGRDALKWMKLVRPHMRSRRGKEIDEIIENISNNRPHYELGSDFCKRGHSIKNYWEYFHQIDGGRRCKKCVGVRIKVPIIISSNNELFINPFKKVV
jgi:hypothetical protein